MFHQFGKRKKNNSNREKIQLNGKKITVKQKISLFELLKKYKLDKKKVAVELNGSIILKQLYKKKTISENDKIEIVHFIGGGYSFWKKIYLKSQIKF